MSIIRYSVPASFATRDTIRCGNIAPDEVSLQTPRAPARPEMARTMLTCQHTPKPAHFFLSYRNRPLVYIALQHQIRSTRILQYRLQCELKAYTSKLL